MELVKIGDIDIYDVVENPQNYPEELVAAFYDWTVEHSRHIKAVKDRLGSSLQNRMLIENATKTKFYDVNKRLKLLTLKKGFVKCDNKDADILYKKNGFDPLEIGEYIFKPSWTKAKEARKFGGEKQLLIDELFVEGNPTLNIEEIKPI